MLSMIIGYTHYSYNFYNNSIIKFQGLIARQPYLCKNIPYLVCYLDIYGCYVGTFVNSSCDIKINSQNC